MGVLLRHHDYRQTLERMNGQFLYLNDLDPEQDAVLIERLTRSTYDGSSFSLIPTCACGETTKDKSPNVHEGDRCPYCFTEVCSPTHRKIESRLWIRTPPDVVGFLLPRFVSVLLDVYGRSKTAPSVIHWLLDPYEKGFDDEVVIRFLEHHGVKRGINYFINNADKVMMLLNNDDIFPKKQTERNQIYAMYQQDKEVLFPTDLPITDKSFNVHEKSHLGNYVDMATMRPYMVAINLILGGGR